MLAKKTNDIKTRLANRVESFVGLVPRPQHVHDTTLGVQVLLREVRLGLRIRCDPGFSAFSTENVRLGPVQHVM